MNNPFQLTGAQVNGDDVPCTGPQIAIVLRALMDQPELIECDWYAAALDPFELLSDYSAATLHHVQDMDDLIGRVGAVGQLSDGVFVAVPRSCVPACGDAHMSADGPAERLVANSIVELHAFDTSWIEVYSPEQTLLAALGAQFDKAGERVLDR
jgi:hypothetical protein